MSVHGHCSTDGDKPMRTNYALHPSCEYLRDWLFQTDRFALAHGLRCVSQDLIDAGMARVDALIAAGAAERGAVATVAEQMADEIEAAAKARTPLHTTDAGYHWQAGKEAAERSASEANAIRWLRTVAYELDAMAGAHTAEAA
jgi:hypothetical protein